MAQAISTELGAPITFAQRAQVGLPLMMMGAFCDVAEGYPWQEIRPGFFGSDLHIRREPVGVVAAIVPWNMPQFLIATKLVPALLAGCCVVLKPAPESPLDALLLADMLEEIGLPPGVVSVLPGDGELGAHLVTPPWRRQGVVHRLDGGRSARGTGVRRRPQAGQPRTRRQVRGASSSPTPTPPPSRPESGPRACPTAARSAMP